MTTPNQVQRPAREVSGDQTTATGGSSNQQETGGKGDTNPSPAIAATADYVHKPSDSPKSGQTVRKGPLPTLPGYEILDELGRGGMGVVYRARQKGLDRIVAIKMLLAADHADSELLARFQTEAQAVATLQHSNIVQIYEIGQHNGLPFFSLEFVPGGSLAEKINRQPQPADESARLVEILARAMHVAHLENIVHRDLKPANVLLTFAEHTSDSSIHLDASGHKLSAKGPLRAATPKISDFGLAKRLAIDSQQTRSGQIMGSPSYMAPEQARGEVRQVGPLADVYALGAILYELLTGRPPFLAGNLVETIQEVVSTEPIPPSRLAVGVPRDLETICLKCLQKDPRKRYPSAEALAEDLRHYLRREPIVARPVGNAERFWRWCRRNPILASATSAALLLLVAMLIVLASFGVTVSRKNARIESEKQTAQTNEKLASDQSKQFLETIQVLVNQVQQELSTGPSTQSIRKKILDLANDRLKRVSNLVDKSTSKEATQLSIHQGLGDLFVQLGEMAKALEQYKKAEALARERVEIRQHSDSSRGNLAMVLRKLGQVSQEVDRDMNVAKKYYEESVEIRQSILDEPFAGDGNAAPPDVVRFELAEDHMRVGVATYKLGDPAGAMPHWQQGLDLRLAVRDAIAGGAKFSDLDRQRMANLSLDIARSKLGIGELSFRLRDPAKALALYSEITAIYEKNLEKHPTVAALKHEVGRVLGNYSNLKLAIEGPAAALPHYERSRKLLRELAENDPNDAVIQRDLGLACYQLGNCLLRANDPPHAAEQFAESQRVREQLVALDPSNDRRQMDLMLALAHCGDHLRATEIAKRYWQRTLPDNELLIDVARCLAQCSVAAGDDGYAQQAISAIEQAMANQYKDIVYLESEPDLDPLREIPPFRLLPLLGRNKDRTRLNGQ